MFKKGLALSFLLALVSLALTACGGTESAIATGIAQTQQISELETAAAGNANTATPTPEATVTVEEAGGSAGVTTNQDVNMRAGDSTAYGVMTIIPGGEVLQITGINAAGTWYQVLYHDATGWVSIDFTTGTPPANLQVVSPPPPPAATATSQSNQTDYEDYFLGLDYSDDQNREVSGEVSGNKPSRITIRVEGMSGNDEGEIDIAFQCDTSEPEKVEISSAGATDNTICNNNWSYAVDADHDTVTIFVELNGGGSVEWTCIANVGPES